MRLRASTQGWLAAGSKQSTKRAALLSSAKRDLTSTANVTTGGMPKTMVLLVLCVGVVCWCWVLVLCLCFRVVVLCCFQVSALGWVQMKRGVASSTNNSSHALT